MKKVIGLIVIISVIIIGLIYFALGLTPQRTPQNTKELLKSQTSALEGTKHSENDITAPPSYPSSLSSEKVPNLALKDYSGKTVILADFLKKPLVINFWATWCPFCRQELIDFAAIQKEFEDEIIIIAINRAEVREMAKKYTDELGVTTKLTFLLDPNDSFYQSIGGFTMPETIFATKNGTIVFRKRGPINLNEMREKINQLISL